MSPLLRRLYLANAAVLLVHQMDAAYWHEWTLFRMPGGIDLYLVLNVPITLAILSGYGAVTAGRASALAYAWLVAASGLFASGFHAWHLAGGDPAFRALASLALLADTALLSAAQAALLVRHRRRTTTVRAVAV